MNTANLINYAKMGYIHFFLGIWKWTRRRRRRRGRASSAQKEETETSDKNDLRRIRTRRTRASSLHRQRQRNPEHRHSGTNAASRSAGHSSCRRLRRARSWIRVDLQVPFLQADSFTPGFNYFQSKVLCHFHKCVHWIIHFKIWIVLLQSLLKVYFYLLNS